MRIVLAPDSFKGSLSATAAAKAMAEGIVRVMPQASIFSLPIADGGEGFVEALVTASGGTISHCSVLDPLGQRILARWGVLGDGQTAVIEMAAASGLTLVPLAARNPCFTSTFGTGELLREALDRGCRKIIIGIGGSATNDGGVGMAQALGVRFLDAEGNALAPGGLALLNLASLDLSQLDRRISECEIVAACDVTNPLLGPLGASAVYGPQKGATKEMVVPLDAALANYARVILSQCKIDITNVPGGGAAGGLGAGLMVFLKARLTPGFDVVAQAVHLSEAIQDSDLVITGEGSVDGQTAQGKAVFGVASLGKKFDKPVIVLGGAILPSAQELLSQGVTASLSIVTGPMPLAACMDEAAALLAGATETTMRLLCCGMGLKR